MKYSKHVISITKAIIIILVLHARLVIINNPSDECFADFGLIDVVATIGIAYISAWLEKQKGEFRCLSIILAILFAVSYVVDKTFLIYMSSVFFVVGIGQLCYALFCITGYALLFDMILQCIFVLLCKYSFGSPNESNNPINKRYELFTKAGIMLLAWTPWLLFNFPGSACIDANEEVKQVLGIIPFNAMHPVLSTAIMGGLAWFGGAVGYGNIGLFLYDLLQAVVGSFVFSYGILKLREYGLQRRVCNFILAFFALCPIWGSFIQWFEKDLLYTEVATLFLIMLFDIVRGKIVSTKSMVGLICVSIVVSLLRNNGIYAIVPTLFVLVIYLKKNNRAKAFICLAAVLLVYVSINRVVFPNLGVEKGTVREALSVPFQQTARVVKEYGDRLTGEEYEAIDAVLDIETIAEEYNPVLSDAVKRTYKEDSSKLPNYFMHWLRMFFKYPRTYVEAAICISYGYLAPVDSSIENSVRIGEIEEFLDAIKSLGVNHPFDERLGFLLLTIKNMNGNMPLIKYTAMAGSYTWILILIIGLLLRKKRWGELILSIPLILNFLVCVASPCANSIAYYLSNVAGTPFLFGMLLIVMSEEK